MDIDINKYITNETSIVDDATYLQYIKLKALEQDINLTADHIEVIQFLEDNSDTQKSAATLLRELGHIFAYKGGKKYLYTIFPYGPITQGSEIALLPLPKGTREYAWGTVF